MFYTRSNSSAQRAPPMGLPMVDRKQSTSDRWCWLLDHNVLKTRCFTTVDICVEDGSDVLFEQLSTLRTWGRLQLGNNQQVFGSWMKCTGWSPLWGLPRLPSSMPFCRVFTKAYMRCHFAGQSKILSQPTLSTV